MRTHPGNIVRLSSVLVALVFGMFLTPSVPAAFWTTNSPMITGRHSHTATLLPNGKILVAGGADQYGYLDTAELYDPATGKWTSTGDMAAKRLSPTATLLLNGKVLVVGGWHDPNVSVSNAELYDPATGRWTTTGALNTPRYVHTATLLRNGTVLVAGGGNRDTNYLTSAEIYDPVTEVWKATSAMSAPRTYHSATLLPNGNVLVAGGTASSGILDSAELYDPATGKWQATGRLTGPRDWQAATLLPNGEVLLAGGFGSSGLISRTELYDPATRTWTASGGLATARYWHTATLLPNCRVLVTGGEITYSSIVSSTELYDVGLGFSAFSRPQITTVTSPFNFGSNLVITGSKFRGISGGSGGNTQDSPGDYPLVQLRSIENGLTTFLLTMNWSTNSFTSLPVWNFPPGYALATVFVNGIPSTSSIVNVSVPIPTATTLTGANQQTNGSFQFAFTNSVGAVFGVLATTNVALPSSNWTALGGVTEISPGQFQFTDPQATNFGQRFYRLRSP